MAVESIFAKFKLKFNVEYVINISLIPTEYGVILKINDKSIDMADITPNKKLFIKFDSYKLKLKLHIVRIVRNWKIKITIIMGIIFSKLPIKMFLKKL